MSGLKLRRWEVWVDGYGSSVELATSRGKALASVWRCDIFNGYTFGEFLKKARCRLSAYQPKPIEITVLGKPAFYLDHNNQYVQFAWPDGEFVLNAHPYDVQPESFRPASYRSALASTQEAAS
jgi:hypothetical protein